MKEPDVMKFFSRFLRKNTEETPFCSAVIAAAGASRRIDAGDKMFLQIQGAPVLAHTLSAFENCSCISEIIVVAREGMFELVSEICLQHGISKVTKIMFGGKTRLESVSNGVYAVSKKAKLVAVHDGARPCVDGAIIDRTVAAAAKYHAAAAGIPASSTYKRVKGGVITETVDREDLFEIQTPQVFTADLIKAALTNAIDKSLNVTDDCMAAEIIGVPIHITEGSRNNIKLTTNEDIILAEAILRDKT
jgi:2-C-methyl-D-erythritol 4-phosphate cytidylyltransferase